MGAALAWFLDSVIALTRESGHPSDVGIAGEAVCRFMLAVTGLHHAPDNTASVLSLLALRAMLRVAAAGGRYCSFSRRSVRTIS